jgi:hypothetical protein
MLVLALMQRGQYEYLWILNLSYLNAKGKDQNLVLNKMCKRVWYESLY